MLTTAINVIGAIFTDCPILRLKWTAASNRRVEMELLWLSLFDFEIISMYNVNSVD